MLRVSVPMMIATRWRPLGVVLCVSMVGCGLLTTDPSLPVYTSEQTDSAHADHRRTTVSSAGAVYVNDLEEQVLELRNRDPKPAIGRSRWGGGMICAIEGQDPSAYVAVDVGSEMPAYAVYRNVNHPLFDWRHATFQSMRLDMLLGPAANKESTDAALLDDVLRTLRDDAPADPPLAPVKFGSDGSPAGVHGLLLFSDALPGLIVRPWVYLDPSSEQVYLADDIAYTYGREPSAKATWIPASHEFALWATTH